jgi:type I restriction enzyme, S subunit
VSRDYAEAAIGDVAELIRGVTYSKADATHVPHSGYSPVLRATNIQDSRLVLDQDLVFVPSTNVSAAQRLRAGDIVVATSSGSKHLVGKSALMRTDWVGSFGAFCAAIRPRPNVEPRYLAAFLRSPQYWRQIGQKAMGVNINNLRRADIESVLLPVPSVAVQRRIVTEIEKQFSRLDEAVASLRRVKANLKRYKMAALRDGVEGRLADTEGHVARTSPSGSRIELPAGWTWTNVANVGKLQLGRQRSPKYHTGPNMRPYLRVQNVFEDRLDLADVMEMDFGDADFARFALQPGDILLNEGQSPELLGRAAMYRGELPGACFTNTLIRFQAHSCVLPTFALIVFRHYMHSGRFAKESNITTNIAHLSLGRLANVEFPLPPISEQQRIAEDVERRLSIVGELEAEVEANLKRAQSLQKATLGKAFSGS